MDQFSNVIFSVFNHFDKMNDNVIDDIETLLKNQMQILRSLQIAKKYDETLQRVKPCRFMN